MAQTIDASQDISKRAHEMYERTLRAQVEHGDNIDKILVLDVDSGAYEIDADGIVANDRLRAKYPALNPLALFAIRIGYDAVYSLGGAGVHRTKSLDEVSVQDYSAQRHEWLDHFDVDMLVAQIQQRNKQMNNTVIQPRLSNEDISRRGEELYARDLRETLETDDNIGKILALDINTGAYEIDVYSLPAADRLRARVPDAVVYALRIGYDAVYALGGTITRTKQ